MTDEASQSPFQCSHCESLGEVTFSSYQRKHQNVTVKVWVKKLPEGILESGVKNLFLAIGKPISISHSIKHKSALVEFEFMNEAELAVRDLNGKPPYNLKVSILSTKPRDAADGTKAKGNKSETHEVWDFSQQDISKKPTQCVEAEEHNKKTKEVVNQVRNIINNLHYDPSIRMRQKKLDFKTEYECISLGRGYLNMGTTDRFVGGLQKFESTAKNSKAKDRMTFSCTNCEALTTKICGRCSASYCSKTCLSNSAVDHRKGCAGVRPGESQNSPCPNSDLNQSLDHSCSQVPLTSGCVVVISTYFTMQTVFVRRSDEPWEEKFTRLCNDVAAEAFKGGKLEGMPQAGDLVIARYYQDLCYYRARIVSVARKKIDLVFIDFGNSQETDVEDLKPLPEHLKLIAAFATKVNLKGVSDDSSADSVNYYNKLTAERVPLILNFDDATGDVVLTEKDSSAVVNETVMTYMLPSWKKDSTALSKSGEVFYLDSMDRQQLEVGKTCNLIVSHFDEKEFLESEVFWMTNPETDDFFHANSQMYLKIREYCEFLKDDPYLPRDNELCLAKEGGEWHRCLNLKSHKTTCCLFFLDDGHSSLIETENIRKMIGDFTEAPSQVVCCTLPDNPKLKTEKEIRSKAVRYLKESMGQTIESVQVLKLMGDAYCLCLPEINKMLS